MAKDIYKDLNKKKEAIENVENAFSDVLETLKELKKDTSIAKVRVVNPPAEVEFPEVQKVEVINPLIPEKAEKIVIPDSVKVQNVDEIAKLLAEKIVIPTEVKITNPTPETKIPIGKGDIPKEADPEIYVPVRLTDGQRFYSAMRDAYTSAAKTVFPFVDNKGAPKPVQLDQFGNIPVGIQIDTVNLSVSGTQNVQGTSPSAQTDDGSNPVKIGGTRRATLPTYLDGQRSSFHVDENGQVLIRVAQPLTISGTPSIKIFDANSAQMGIPTNPLTISGTVAMLANTSTTLSGVGAVVQSVKSGNGIFDGYMIYNPNSTVAYVQVFDNTAPTVGVTNPDIILPIPATGAANLAEIGRTMNNAIKLACTTTAKGSTPPTTGLDMTIFYK